MVESRTRIFSTGADRIVAVNRVTAWPTKMSPIAWRDSAVFFWSLPMVIEGGFVGRISSGA